MHGELKQRIENMRARMAARTPVAEVSVASQLFVTPDPVCARLVMLAGMRDGDTVLEPSAGTGAILRAVRDVAPGAECEAVELDYRLAQHLTQTFDGVRVTCGDFAAFTPARRYSKILMNPPFRHGLDMKHIRHALTLLAPGGMLVAVCPDGPRQRATLQPLAEVWEPLPRGTFAYTDVATAVLAIAG
ncbi:class I SAM-dependent methyltransferase (plasmid) [Paramixta manurensis]|uniref:Class I SAM-dependent methyltransferase n=1 Tax=Paramixta manurensis TaxID=2740817 RepID=A0A6M8UIB1_9GAMM|nr:class I SAM-dependent methyltransferase [Erwiniaceae bacterium PD-1]